ncbi:MAG TPA: IS66 family insertion sequence element accessory protein TnpB [Bacteriovoracaceae bacterium]|nr:IS66 family insertion sequence element accessory protein TnpB [Bacteriovoracaceae bacterium]
MKSPSDFDSIYLWRSPTDFRKSINGLSAMVQEEMKLDPYSKSLFIFCCQRRKRLKVLYWDRTGFALWYKRLEEDLFPWPKNLEVDIVEISSKQLEWILDGINVWDIKPHSDKKYSKSC